VKGVLISVIAASVSLVGCASVPQTLQTPKPGDEKWAPTFIENNAVKANPGSLYAAGQNMSLFKDRRAYRTGDVLTVILDEETKSSKNSGASMGKTTDIGIEAPTFGISTVNKLAASVNAGRNFSGEANANQRNSLSGFITVTVSEVKANGVLVIKGEKWLKLNQGDEYIRLMGIIRADDIDENNRVSSQRIADAQITYAGRGSLADSSEPGWVSKMLQSPWFPF
jgi:flagellar L-ring protein precursor FlgH